MRRETIALLIAAALSGVLFFSIAYVTAQEGAPPVSVIEPEPEFLNEKAEGKIDRIAAREIVIDDSLYAYSSKVKFLTFGGEEVSLRFFIKGDKVIYMLDEKGKIVLLQKK